MTSLGISSAESAYADKTRARLAHPLHQAARYQYSRYSDDGSTITDHEEDVEGPFYHGSRSRSLKPGDELTIGRKTNNWGDEGKRSQFVHITDNPDTARTYAQSAGGYAYEVEPTGVIRPGYGGGEYRTEHPVRVVRRLD